MITFAINDYAHRLLSNGILISAPINAEGIVGDFEQRSDREMNLTGGDVAKIKGTLKEFGHIFQEGYRLPETEQKEQREAVVAPV